MERFNRSSKLSKGSFSKPRITFTRLKKLENSKNKISLNVEPKVLTIPFSAYKKGLSTSIELINLNFFLGKFNEGYFFKISIFKIYSH